MSVLRYSSNKHGRDFVVGDIHGERELFQRLLNTAHFNPQRDRVFSVGDLVDRGPESPACLLLLANPWFMAVRGNHEDMLLRTFAGTAEPTHWLVNGGRWWLSVSDELRAPMAAVCNQLPLAIVVGEGADRFNVLHAEFYGSDADIDHGVFSRDMQQAMLWGRDLISGFGVETPDLSTTYVGHTIVDTVRRIGSHVFIDTGSCRPGGTLTMIEPATGRTHSVTRDDYILSA